MKILSSLQELWEYFQYCPICNEHCRKVTVSVGPDRAFELLDFFKKNNDLTIKCEFRNRISISEIYYNVDCQTGEFQVHIGEPRPLAFKESVQRATKAYFYFYLNADCEKCSRSYASSSDIELDLTMKMLHPIGVEREGVYLWHEGNGYHITCQYDLKEIKISKLELKNGSILDDGRIFECPLVNLDFTDPGKTINKIKTLILFS